MTFPPPPLPPDRLLRFDTNQDWENCHKAGEVLRELAWNQRLEVDGLCIKLAKCGSLSDGILIANIAALRHLPVTPVSASGTSLSAAANLQMLCIMPFLSSTVELCHYMLPEDIGWPKLSNAPVISVPETAGMVAEVD